MVRLHYVILNNVLHLIKYIYLQISPVKNKKQKAHVYITSKQLLNYYGSYNSEFFNFIQCTLIVPNILCTLYGSLFTANILLSLCTVHFFSYTVYCTEVNCCWFQVGIQYSDCRIGVGDTPFSWQVRDSHVLLRDINYNIHPSSGTVLHSAK